MAIQSAHTEGRSISKKKNKKRKKRVKGGSTSTKIIVTLEIRISHEIGARRRQRGHLKRTHNRTAKHGLERTRHSAQRCFSSPSPLPPACTAVAAPIKSAPYKNKRQSTRSEGYLFLFAKHLWCTVRWYCCFYYYRYCISVL